MISLESALAAYANSLRALPARSLPTAAALGAVFAAAVYAETDLPRFDQSAMDGYVMRAEDLDTASPEHPVELLVTLHIAASGQDDAPRLARGCAARIFTGALLPEGANTMIPQERAERIGDRLRFIAPYPPARNIRRRGEELQRGARLADAGQRMGPGLLASLVNADVRTVQVHARPRVRVFVTGDEIRPAGAPLRPGEIHDSNGPLVGALLADWGYRCEPAQHLGDDEGEVRAALAQAFEECDLVISTGGASVGDKDYLPKAAEALGAQRVFWKVAQKPAKPLFFGVREKAGRQCAMLALPGNPGAVLIGMLLHVKTALDVLEGLAEPGVNWTHGVLNRTIERDSERTRLVRMRRHHDESGTARLEPLPNQDSHMLSNLGRADVLVRIDAGTEAVAAGSTLLWTPMPG